MEHYDVAVIGSASWAPPRPMPPRGREPRWSLSTPQRPAAGPAALVRVAQFVRKSRTSTTVSTRRG
jgi:hypothetical protein